MSDERMYVSGSFPHPQDGETEVIDLLRRVHVMSCRIALLLQCADITRADGGTLTPDEYERLAREAADSMLTVAEDAVKAMQVPT
jgi:hypothetical protein